MTQPTMTYQDLIALYANRPIGEAVKFFEAIRRHVVELVGHLPEAWEQHVILSRGAGTEGKKLTVKDIVSWQVRHLVLHIEQIQETRQVHKL